MVDYFSLSRHRFFRFRDRKAIDETRSVFLLFIRDALHSTNAGLFAWSLKLKSFFFSLSLVGIINTEGAMWKDQRKFLHDKLRGFGMTYMGGGKQIMESRIMVSTVFFCENFCLSFLFHQ